MGARSSGLRAETDRALEECASGKEPLEPLVPSSRVQSVFAFNPELRAPIRELLARGYTLKPSSRVGLCWVLRRMPDFKICKGTFDMRH